MFCEFDLYDEMEFFFMVICIIFEIWRVVFVVIGIRARNFLREAFEFLFCLFSLFEVEFLLEFVDVFVMEFRCFIFISVFEFAFIILGVLLKDTRFVCVFWSLLLGGSFSEFWLLSFVLRDFGFIKFLVCFNILSFVVKLEFCTYIIEFRELGSGIDKRLFLTLGFSFIDLFDILDILLRILR